MLKKGTTDFATGFLGASAVATEKIKEKDYLSCDWERVIEIIRQNKDKTIHVGLAQDWGNTSGIVFEDGEFVYNYVYASSNWATPALEIEETGELIDVSKETENSEPNLPSDWIKNKI